MKKTYEHVIPRRVVVIDYDHDERRDTFTIEFSGALLRDDDMDWRELHRALSAVAGPAPA